jgi:hypothetical protein
MFDIAGQPVLDKRSLVGGCVRLNLGTSGERLELLVRALPRSYTGRGLNLPGPQLAAIRGTDLGCYGAALRDLVGERDGELIALHGYGFGA